MATPIPEPRTRSGIVPSALGLFVRFRRDASGATAIEYALITGLIFLAIVGSLKMYSDRVNTMYNVIGTAIANN